MSGFQLAVEPKADAPRTDETLEKEGNLMKVRLGDILVARGAMSAAQVAEVVAMQKTSGRPFGVLAEEHCGIDPREVEAAWAQQYAGLTRSVDPMTEQLEGAALTAISRRQAWQFRVFPIRFEDGELMIATTQEDLGRALRFATNVIGSPCAFVMTSREALCTALSHHYPVPGLGLGHLGEPATEVA
jgi:hypothetical protein